MSERVGTARIPQNRFGHCYSKEFELPDISRKVERFILQPFRPANMQFEQICVNGLQGSGKTYYCYYWEWKIRQHYQLPTYTIYTNDLAVAYEEIKNMPEETRIVVIILVDAMSHQSSYEMSQQTDKVKVWYEIRHEVKRKIGDTGIVFALLDWQRYSSVNANFRNPQLFAVMSPMVNSADVCALEDIIGKEGYREVKKEYAARQLANERRSRVVVSLPGTIGNNTGYHEYRFMGDEPEWEEPEFLDSIEYFKPPTPLTKEELLDRLSDDARYREQVVWYRRYIAGEKQVAIAAEHGKGKSTISEGIARITDLLNESGGV